MAATDPLVALLLKHLPPSAAVLRLLDLTGGLAAALRARRDDLDLLTALPATTDQLDAVAAIDPVLEADFLLRMREVLRPGGRLIVILRAGEMGPTHVQLLETAGYTRILVEPTAAGLLVRGEKPHTTADTLERVESVAGQDTVTDLAEYRGRYVHLLVQQRPNKPAWALAPDEAVTWWAAALSSGELLAFSSLPRAVAFMQPAVLAGRIRDINKVARYRREIIAGWGQPLIFNPTLDGIAGAVLELRQVDPAGAEVPDE